MKKAWTLYVDVAVIDAVKNLAGEQKRKVSAQVEVMLLEALKRDNHGSEEILVGGDRN